MLFWLIYLFEFDLLFDLITLFFFVILVWLMSENTKIYKENIGFFLHLSFWSIFKEGQFVRIYPNFNCEKVSQRTGFYCNYLFLIWTITWYDFCIANLIFHLNNPFWFILHWEALSQQNAFNITIKLVIHSIQRVTKNFFFFRRIKWNVSRIWQSSVYWKKWFIYSIKQFFCWFKQIDLLMHFPRFL